VGILPVRRSSAVKDKVHLQEPDLAEVPIGHFERDLLGDEIPPGPPSRTPAVSASGAGIPP